MITITADEAIKESLKSEPMQEYAQLARDFILTAAKDGKFCTEIPLDLLSLEKSKKCIIRIYIVNMLINGGFKVTWVDGCFNIFVCWEIKNKGRISND